VFSVIVAEAVLLCAGGGLVGLLLGHALVFVAGPIVEAKSDILIDPWFFESQELAILPALLVLAVIVGLVPGLTAYRRRRRQGPQRLSAPCEICVNLRNLWMIFLFP